MRKKEKIAASWKKEYFCGGSIQPRHPPLVGCSVKMRDHNPPAADRGEIFQRDARGDGEDGRSSEKTTARLFSRASDFNLPCSPSALSLSLSRAFSLLFDPMCVNLRMSK